MCFTWPCTTRFDKTVAKRAELLVLDLKIFFIIANINSYSCWPMYRGYIHPPKQAVTAA